jgi:hypothetical protein
MKSREIERLIVDLYWSPDIVAQTDDPEDGGLWYLCKLLSLLIGTGDFGEGMMHNDENIVDIIGDE